MATIRQSISTYAITISTFQQHRHFQVTAHAELFIATLFHYRDQGQFLLHAFVVMPDHIHALITPAENASTAKAVQFIKGGYSKAVREVHQVSDVWHTGYHEHRVRDLQDFQAQQQYIANNPLRKNHENYPHVHTFYAPRLDDMPTHWKANPRG